MPNRLLTSKEVAAELNEALDNFIKESGLDRQTATILFMGSINGYSVHPDDFKAALQKAEEHMRAYGSGQRDGISANCRNQIG